MAIVIGFYPSAEELNAMGENLIKNNLGSFYGGTYWSSSKKLWNFSVDMSID